MFKSILLCVGILLTCGGCHRADRRPECSDHYPRPKTFDYEALECGPQVAKYCVYYTYVDFLDNSQSSKYLGGDSSLLQIPENYRQKMDSIERINAYHDSLGAIGIFYDISPRDWRPPGGIAPEGEGSRTMYVQFLDGATNLPISKALSPVSSTSEAFLIAERELEDYWIIDSPRELGQGITSATDGYSMMLLHFERRCPNQILGMVQIRCTSKGQLEVVQNISNFRTCYCQCSIAGS